ncbi:Protein kinase, putative [Hondaea fermentalgiana]|uniref:Protein kinase, putative n=1 Tax=Hondaea fermentalgiana TaxID=2315210 RepID=A0A2R5G8K5_9STRA|nr:Protein kinase, putative [Hondaea fermentalgiana]|eukprot:GBG27396.1 Protein kinase, putative [Hondaea fermentalgiana]
MQVISQGNCSKVYKARFCRDDEGFFALKVYDSSARGAQERKRELRSLRILASSKAECDFVVKPIFNNSLKNIAVEYCAGGDLATLLLERTPDHHEVRRFAFEIACGLQFLHMRMIIHEDVKPGNIGLTADQHIRILDFGLSEVLPEKPSCSFGQDYKPEDGNIRCANRGGVFSRHGTTPYACPEKLRELPHRFEADWWSYGVVIFEMLTGGLPWLGCSAEETCRMICEDPLVVPRALQNEVEPEALRFVHDLIGIKEPLHRLGYRGGVKDFESFPTEGWTESALVPEILRPSLDPEVLSFVQDLIGSKDPLDRLGWRRGLRDLEKHPFFRSIEIQ